MSQSRNSSSGPRILEVTRGPVDLVTPPSSSQGEVWRYGLAVPFQVAPGKAGLFCNIREVLGPEFDCFDFEVGNDVILFDDLSSVSVHGAVPINRNHDEINPNAGVLSLMIKYPVLGGFVPLGACLADGTPHPHAGTGFGISRAIAWPPKNLRATAKMNHGRYGAYAGEKKYSYFELYQFAYNGTTFTVTHQERLAVTHLLPGFALTSFGLTPPIPDAGDFLYPAVGRPVDTESQTGMGLSRWQRTHRGWRPVAFQTFTEEPHLGEMSMVRDVDGSLLYSARGGSRDNCLDFWVWRSADNGASWEDFLKVLWVRSAAPVTINQAADGTPYLIANLLHVPLTSTVNERKATRDPWGCIYLGGVQRDQLYLWPLDASRWNLLEPLVVRDCHKDWGPPPGGTTWSADHPIGLTLQLADGKWHNVLTYRSLEHGENGQGCAATPHTGCHVEEVLSEGLPKPMWEFTSPNA